MLNADVLTFQEFVKHETLPLSQIHGAVLEFLQGRDDVVLFGAQAVNAYVSEPRMTQHVDLLSTRARELAEELRTFLSDQFFISVRIREVGGAKGFRIYQTRKDGNRHLVDIRSITSFPETERIEDILVLSPLELIVSKVISYHSRRGKPKSGTDWRDLAVLLLRFPELRKEIPAALSAKNVSDVLLETWKKLDSQDFQLEEDDSDLVF